MYLIFKKSAFEINIKMFFKNLNLKYLMLTWVHRLSGNNTLGLSKIVV